MGAEGKRSSGGSKGPAPILLSTGKVTLIEGAKPLGLSGTGTKVDGRVTRGLKSKC